MHHLQATNHTKGCVGRWVSWIPLFYLILFSLPATAQSQYEITGQVIDDSTNAPVSYAQVALYRKGASKAISGTVTDDQGRFTLLAPPGTYRIAVVFVGYRKKQLKNLVVGEDDQDLGTIAVVSTARQLEEVVVRGKAAPKAITTDVDGLTVRPDQTLTNTGGSLLDVLRNTPSVNVSQDGSISLRGSGTNILINGRNSALATDLEQLPASAIKSIKIINNPNAKYDASGTGGIINIELKKGADRGTNGKVEYTLGNRYRMNANVRLNHRTDNFGVYGGYSFRRWPRVGNSNSTRLTFDNDQRLDQWEDSRRNDLEHTVNYGADYTFGNNKLSYEGAVNFEDEEDFENNRSRVTNTETGAEILQYSRLNNEVEDNYTLDNALVYERLFDNDSGREFRATVSHSYRDQNEVQNIDVYNGQVTSEGSPTGRQRANTDELNQTFVAQADYVQPLWEGKLETGLKTIIRSFDTDYRYEIREARSGAWENQPNTSNHFLYDDQVYAGYLIYSHSFHRLDLSAGVRAEQTLVDTKLLNTGEANNQNYLNFFPSFRALYHVTDNQSVKLTYSRRIDRPGGWRLNPFADISDSLNVRVGNPALRPEYINSYEAGYHVTLGQTDLTSNLFYRQVKGDVDYIVRLENGISYRQPANLNTSKTFGLELIGVTEIFSWWNLNASTTLFRTQVDGSNLGQNFTNKGYSLNARLTSELQLPMDVSLQLTGSYSAPEIEAQGRDFARYYLDASLQRRFFNDKANVNLTLRDVFNTRRFRGENFGPNFSQTFNYKRESRYFLLSVGYNF
ncbi:Outer membrane receptor proteins, mostly Fe transport [Catalinimonas alkaloidigena]|uniref:Outer membrane receptor proteins, mostly Fe transport n=1 Tax=Catalinimonas alkaloidigena TaxID=1075417 RepID=A0A1G8ZP86_9BACT|nr:TonB-dependent receptor [Catalinimonas alkaloidigena]SDK16837.1 Outer membrane receptor proteins, mostly Fe transport [Catalinimonas alkaloidigena]